MLVLLPPSESKAPAPRRGSALDAGRLSFPELAATRARVLAALHETSAGPDALGHLGVGASLAAEVAANLALATAPARPAHVVYTGVLYDALGWASLSAAARRRGASRVVIASALWGLLRPNDRIPAYRLSIAALLPSLGATPAALWRRELPAVLAAAAGPRGLVVDCRSGPYAAAAPLPRPLAARTVQVRVVRDGAGGRTVVSHLAKHTRGEVTRALLELGADPRTPPALAAALGAGWKVELVEPAAPGRPWALDVVLPA